MVGFPFASRRVPELRGRDSICPDPEEWREWAGPPPAAIARAERSGVHRCYEDPETIGAAKAGGEIIVTHGMDHGCLAASGALRGELRAAIQYG